MQGGRKDRPDSSLQGAPRPFCRLTSQRGDVGVRFVLERLPSSAGILPSLAVPSALNFQPHQKEKPIPEPPRAGPLPSSPAPLGTVSALGSSPQAAQLTKTS